MARARRSDAGKSRRRVLIYAIPVLALIGVSVVYALSVLPAPAHAAAEDFTFALLIDVSNSNSSQERAIAPNLSIGEAGGYWNSHQYDMYGVDTTHYPLYMDSPATACKPACTIHVKSTVARAYTLQDFFNVYGYPVGQNLTLTQRSYGTFAWQMCVGIQNPTNSNEWGAHVLVSGEAIRLFFHDTTGLGCAPS
jgi:hypothetical protein